MVFSFDENRWVHLYQRIFGHHGYDMACKIGLKYIAMYNILRSYMFSDIKKDKCTFWDFQRMINKYVSKICLILLKKYRDYKSMITSDTQCTINACKHLIRNNFCSYKIVIFRVKVNKIILD